MSSIYNTIGKAKNKEVKPGEPTSILTIETLMMLEEYLILRWEELVKADTSLLIGIKSIELFDLQKLRDLKLCEIKRHLSDYLPEDTYEYLKYQRRVQRKKSVRHVRERSDNTCAKFHQSDMCILGNIRDRYREEKNELLAEISFYEEAFFSEGINDLPNHQDPHNQLCH